MKPEILLKEDVASAVEKHRQRRWSLNFPLPLNCGYCDKESNIFDKDNGQCHDCTIKEDFKFL